MFIKITHTQSRSFR